MEKPINNYRKLRLEAVKLALEENNFEVFVTPDPAAAKALVLDEILPGLPVKTISWGGSTTFVQTGLYEALKNDARFSILDTYDKSLAPEQLLDRRRQSLQVDLFITGTNAITEYGQLVNLDMIGNRIGAITFGPRHVILLAGRNKIVADLEDAMVRVKNYAAPVNAMRLDKKTPCIRTGTCQDCKSPERICNHWAITEKSFPKGRIKIVLIDADLGF